VCIFTRAHLLRAAVILQSGIPVVCDCSLIAGCWQL